MSLEAYLHEHIHLENNILFPRAIAKEQAAGTELETVTLGRDYGRCLALRGCGWPAETPRLFVAAIATDYSCLNIHRTPGTLGLPQQQYVLTGLT